MITLNLNTYTKLLAGFILVGLVLAFLPYASNVQAQSQSKEERRQELQSQYDQLQETIRKKKEDLKEQKSKSQTLSKDVSQLESEIQQAEQAIQARQAAIGRLSGSIAESRQKIDQLSERIERSQKTLSQLIREMSRKGEVSTLEVVMSNQTLSEFFEDIETFSTTRDDIEKKLGVIKEARILTKSKQERLRSEKLSQEELKQVQQLEKKKVSRKESQKEELLAQSKTKENFHENVIERKEKDAAQIRQALFALRGADTEINFGQALELSRQVSDYTGVRPAFLLAILKQESRIGQNVGTCNLPDSPPSQKWDQIMKPSRDIEPYKRIVDSLGIEPDTKPLSCPQSIGYGGAMGPAQFIPSTWEQFIPKIQSATGSNPPSPWNPRDAFFASGIYLSELGAGAGTRSAEIEAAGRYFAGGNWRQNGMYYARNVQNLAQDIKQNQIDPLDNS